MIKKGIQLVSGLIDKLVMAAVIIVLLFSIYAIWDTNRLGVMSEAGKYTKYKPTEKKQNFDELKAINKEVCWWINVYGTGIDYPVFQSDNNDKYVHTNANGQYAMSGALFLDSRNSSEGTDFNSIIYGHHMEKSRMFGDLDKFENQKFFNNHRYGKVFINNRYLGIEFFALLKEDAYNTNIYQPAIIDTSRREEYIKYIKDNAEYTTSVEATINDKLIILSTCASVGTNERILLVGKQMDTIPDNIFDKIKPRVDKPSLSFKFLDRISFMSKLLIIVVLLLLILLIVRFFLNGKNIENKRGDES